MTQTFYEWLEENPEKSYADIYDFGLTSFEAGAQSKQAEIDDHIKRRLELAKEKQGLINEINELRKRIDEALRFYNNAKSPHNIGMIQMAIYLKGTTNEQ